MWGSECVHAPGSLLTRATLRGNKLSSFLITYYLQLWLSAVISTEYRLTPQTEPGKKSNNRNDREPSYQNAVWRFVLCIYWGPTDKSIFYLVPVPRSPSGKPQAHWFQTTHLHRDVNITFTGINSCIAGLAFSPQGNKSLKFESMRRLFLCFPQHDLPVYLEYFFLAHRLTIQFSALCQCLLSEYVILLSLLFIAKILDSHVTFLSLTTCSSQHNPKKECQIRFGSF